VTAEQADLAPYVAFTFRTDGLQYLIVSDGQSSSAVWDVTDPANPQRVRTLAFGIVNYAKNGAGDAIAIVRAPSSTTLQIYTPAALVADGTPTIVQSNTNFSATTNFKFRRVTSDGIK